MSDGTPVWLITGCSTGFGKEMAKLVLARGWRAVVTARKPEQMADLVAGNENNVLALELDVTEKAQVASVVKEAEARFGQVDVLVNNAGYGYLAAIEEGEDEAVRTMFETNFFGLVELTKAVLPGMRARKSGTIVNVSSIGGLVSFGATGYYHATKYAVEGLSESLHIEVAPLGIKVMIVEPGPFRTDWSGRSLLESKTVIEDYDPTAGLRRRQSRANSGKQKGDRCGGRRRSSRRWRVGILRCGCCWGGRPMSLRSRSWRWNGRILRTGKRLRSGRTFRSESVAPGGGRSNPRVDDETVEPGAPNVRS